MQNGNCSFKTVVLSSILNEWLALLTPLDEICISRTTSSAASQHTGQCLVSKFLHYVSPRADQLRNA